jgi:O-antigen/teichoic acid export membrane protein
VTNVLWTWGGVAVGVISGFLVSPYTIRKLGDVNFSIWSLALSLVEYYWLIDFGLRSATLKMSAEYKALDDHEHLNELLSTGIVYSSVMGALLAVATLALAPYAGGFFHIEQPAFRQLILIAGLSWSLGMTFNVYGACLDGFQRFDIFARIWMSTTLLRSTGVVLVLYFGYGLLQMGFVLLGSQLLVYLLTYVCFRHVVRYAQVSYGRASFSMFRKMISYGIHTLTSNVSTQLLHRSVPALIAYYLPVQYVAYYMVPVRIMDYAGDGVGRVGTVTAPNATELMAHGRKQELVSLGILTNRYCLSLFMPVTAFLLVYGYEVYSMWIRPSFAQASAYLLPVLLLGNTAMFGQFNSVSILFGMARHQTYARCLLGEAILTVVGMMFVLPRYGLWGGVWLVAILMLVNRAVIVCLLASRELEINPLEYAARIYTVPTLLGAGATLFLLALKRTWIPGRTWGQAFLAVVLMAIPYTLLVYRFCLVEHHREMVRNKLRSILRMPQPAV